MLFSLGFSRKVAPASDRTAPVKDRLLQRQTSCITRSSKIGRILRCSKKAGSTVVVAFFAWNLEMADS